MKKIYSQPECNTVAFDEQAEILTGSYKQGGASGYGSEDIFDNGNY